MAPTDVSSETISVLRRPWIRYRNLGIPDRALVLAKRNYKGYADVGLPNPYMGRQLSVVDTGALPNLINLELVPPALRAHIRCGPGLDIADANDKPQKTVGYVHLVLRLGTFMFQLEFVVCDKLVPSVILFCDFCDQYLEATRLCAKNVETVLQYL